MLNNKHQDLRCLVLRLKNIKPNQQSNKKKLIN